MYFYIFHTYFLKCDFHCLSKITIFYLNNLIFKLKSTALTLNERSPHELVWYLQVINLEVVSHHLKEYSFLTQKKAQFIMTHEVCKFARSFLTLKFTHNPIMSFKLCLARTENHANSMSFYQNMSQLSVSASSRGRVTVCLFFEIKTARHFY